MVLGDHDTSKHTNASKSYSYHICECVSKDDKFKEFVKRFYLLDNTRICSKGQSSSTISYAKRRQARRGCIVMEM